MRDCNSQVVEDEQQLILRWRRGDRGAFECLVKKYMRQAYFIALGLVGQHDDALDLSQEAFVRAYRYQNRFDPKHRFFPWFYQVLKNLCFNWLNDQREKRYTSIEELIEKDEEPQWHNRFDPDLIAERDAIKERVWKAMAALKPHHREIIVLRHFQNLSYRQISEVLFCSQGTVMSRLYYARKALRRKLERGGFEDELREVQGSDDGIFGQRIE
ncbi:MAG: RNA polymerase sigma factor [bacterium]